MLDNVIDNNYYPTPESKTANLRHRAIGLGMMGYQDALYQLNISFDSDENLGFADKSMEMISHYAILASSELAKERGSYETFKGSKWDRGILPYDTLSILEEHRGESLDLDKQIMDWDYVKSHIKSFGMKFKYNGDCTNGNNSKYRRRISLCRTCIQKHIHERELIWKLYCYK